MRICEKLKEIREKKFFSQKEMADYMGVTVATYNHLEKGYKNLSLKTIEKISKITHYGYTYIKEHL